MTETQLIIATLDVKVIGQVNAVSRSFMAPKVEFGATIAV